MCYTILFVLFHSMNDKRMFLAKVVEGFENKSDIDGISKLGWSKLFFPFPFFFSKYITSECFINPKIERKHSFINKIPLYLFLWKPSLRYFLFCLKDYAKTAESSRLLNIKISNDDSPVYWIDFISISRYWVDRRWSCTFDIFISRTWTSSSNIQSLH